MTGLSTATINKLYNEAWTRVDKETIIKFCKALGVGVGDLFEYVEGEPEKKAKQTKPKKKGGK